MFGGHVWSRLGKQVSGNLVASFSCSSVVLAHLLLTTSESKVNLSTLCEASTPKPSQPSNNDESSPSSASFTTKKDEQENTYYHKYGSFHPKRQIHEPLLPYPAWDYNWDGRQTSFTSPSFLMLGANAFAASKEHGTTRHIIMIRHGQYNESPSHDGQQCLTPLGRHQAALTGQRLAVMARGGLQGGWSLQNDDKNNFQQQQQQPCHIKAIHVSDMTRAKETAEIIASFLVKAPDNVHTICTKPDPMLNEALPSPMIPMRPDICSDVSEKEIHDNHNRIEAAFHKFIHRADPAEDMLSLIDPHHYHHHVSSSSSQQKPDQDNPPLQQQKHEFEIIVGHGNIIRYFTCRALQIPPEAWLRFSCFNCSITYLMIHPNGYVTCRAFGDMGHLGYDNSTFSGKHGYHWA